MDAPAQPEESPRYLSLRWKSLIALSLALIAVNASLATIANLQLVAQFERQQAAVREQQVRQLRALIDERNREMSKLASLVPLLGNGGTDAEGLKEQIEQALDTNGALLDLEWDIRSAHWVEPEGATSMTWPATAAPLPEALLAQLTKAPESTLETLFCNAACRQYLATPLLWKGRFAGTLVLGRSLADALLTFNALTGAEVAIIWQDAAGGSPLLDPQSDNYLQFPAITYPGRTRPILRAAAETLGASNLPEADEQVSVQHGSGWYEIFRIPALTPGIDALILNDISAQRVAIRAATTGSVALGIVGLFLSGGLLLVIMRGPLYRLRDLASVVPLLAENRFADLRHQLPSRGETLMPRDEIDLMTATVGSLTDRMDLLQRDREQVEERLIWLADHDPLTQLFNRRRFNEDFEQILDRAVRFGHQGALLFFDLDQFKDVNDLSGHRIGDTLLQRVAEQLRQATQQSDLLARLGGDEFALVIPVATEQAALTNAAALQKAIRSISLQERGRRHRVSASIGIVMFPDQGSDVGLLMANADLAMYQAKEKGPGRSYLFSEKDQGKEQLDARVVWREKITQALQQDHFELYAQPVFEIATGKLRHQEVLLRMRDAQGQVVSPQRFIPVAERTGQIQSIDRWVVASSLAAMQASPDLRLSINLSASAMESAELLADLKQLLQQYQVSGERITFEVTETAAINGLLNATRLMRGMQDLGCLFALDDFGSGYASYAYLRQLPVDEIKIDGAFVRDIVDNPEDRIFVKAITDMAHGMRKRVTAEFVESAEILAILNDLGVDDAQGYYLGRPAPLAAGRGGRAEPPPESGTSAS